MTKLGVDAVALGKKAGVHANTVRKFIKGRQVRAADKITAALDAIATANNNHCGAAHAADKPLVWHRAAARAGAHTQRAKRNEPTGDVVGDPAGPPMVFEHTNEEEEYARIAKRIQDGVTELNSALEEAHKRADMRVFLGLNRGGDGTSEPAQLGYHIYRLTHSIVTLAVKTAEPVWRQVKDPSYKDAAGEAFAGLARRQKAEREAAAPA